MTSDIPKDRQFSLDAALAIAQDEAKQNNIDLQFKLITSNNYPTHDLHTIICAANNNQTKLSFIGGGSGHLKLAQVKSLYEALEEALTYQSLCDANENMIDFFSTTEATSTPYLKEQELLPPLLFQKKYTENKYPWIKLYKLQHHTDTLHYPLSLIFPYTHKIDRYNYSIEQHELTELSNGTGIAIGANRHEAITHGIYEWVERDAYALFLLKTIIKKSHPAQFILKETLPNDIRSIIDSIENTYNEDLIVIDITSDIKIPAFLVSFTKQSVAVQPSGLGTSLCKHAALEQALLEALQARDRYNKNTVKVREDSIHHYKSYPLLVKAIKCDLTEITHNKNYITTSWNKVISHQLDIKIQHQLEFLNQLLLNKNHTIFHNILHESNHGLALAYVLISGFETFYLIREGIFNGIKKRGLEALACT